MKIIILPRHYDRFENNRLTLRKNPSCCSKDCNGTDSPNILLAILRYAIDALLSGVNATGAPEFEALITSSLSNTIPRSEEHTSELQSRGQLVCRLLLE